MGLSKYEDLYSRVLLLLDAQDWESAFTLLKNGYMEGDGVSTAILAEFYLYGIGVSEDIETGIDLLEKAIDRGCMEAADKLGSLYLVGEIVPPDEKKGISYIIRAAESGDPLSIGKLANAYLYGTGVNQDYTKAMELGQIAAKQGNRIGMEILAILYDDGLGVAKDPMQAAYWYRECLKLDSEYTFYMYRIAVCLADPFEEFKWRPDEDRLEEAYTWACKGVEKGDLDCHMLVGWFYEMGYVVDRNFDMAYKFFKIAADNGHELSAQMAQRYRRNIFGNYYLPQ